MGILRMTTAGESHGPAEVCILEGVPAGLGLSIADIDADLARRQGGYGRGSRMSIERDSSRFLAGVRRGVTLGTPVCVVVENRDHANWLQTMSPDSDGEDTRTPVTVPRPGHADLAGLAKYGFADARNVLERASARETVGRVAAGAICKALLAQVGVHVRGRVVAIGSAAAGPADAANPGSVDWEAVAESPVACDDAAADALMRAEIDETRAQGESLGGIFEVWCWGMCPGVGGYATPEDRLDGKLMGAIGSIPAIKGVEIGEGFANAGRRGSAVHDAMRALKQGRGGLVRRDTNRAAGIEGGMTNGMPIVVRAAMKPIPTLTKPLPSVELTTLTNTEAHVERSDVCAVPAARVVGEAAAAFVLAAAYLGKFGGDNMDQFVRSVRTYENDLEARGLWRR